MSELNTRMCMYMMFSFATVLFTEAISQNWTNCARSTGWGIVNPNVSESAANELTCVLNCLYLPECVAVEYAAKTNNCSYISQVLRMYRTDASHTVVFLRKNAAIHMSARGVRKAYRFTYNDARDACTLLHSRLMTKDEMWTLYYTGYELCSCGWVLEGGKYFPVQQKKKGCSNYKGLNNCTFTQLAHAWCTFE